MLATRTNPDLSVDVVVPALTDAAGVPYMAARFSPGTGVAAVEAYIAGLPAETAEGLVAAAMPTPPADDGVEALLHAVDEMTEHVTDDEFDPNRCAALVAAVITAAARVRSTRPTLVEVLHALDADLDRLHGGCQVAYDATGHTVDLNGHHRRIKAALALATGGATGRGAGPTTDAADESPPG